MLLVEPTNDKGSWSNDSGSEGRQWSDDGSNKRYVDTNVAYSETSSLSANSPDKRRVDNQTPTNTAGTIGILESAGMGNYSEEDSTSDDDDQKPMLGNVSLFVPL